MAKGSDPGGAGRLHGGEHSSTTVGVYGAEVDLEEESVQTNDFGEEKIPIIADPPMTPVGCVAPVWGSLTPECCSFVRSSFPPPLPSVEQPVLPTAPRRALHPALPTPGCCLGTLRRFEAAFPILHAWGVSRWELSIMLDISSR